MMSKVTHYTDIVVDMADIVKSSTAEAVITVRVKHTRTVMFRLKLAGLIVKFALWVGGFGEREVNIDDQGMLK